jgi:hypothetical protein
MPISTTSNYANAQILLTADVANAGTLTVNYPTGTTQASFTGANAGLPSDNMAIINGVKFTGSTLLTFAYGASNITVTNNTGVTWVAPTTTVSDVSLARFGFPRADPVQIYNGPKAILN